MEIKREWLSKNLTMRNLLLALLFIIFVLPRLFTLDTGVTWLSFKETGQIGDTIGGLTAPFINALAAILVYIAFKEQVLANEILKNQQYYQFIQEQINRLEDKIHDVDLGCIQIKKEIQYALQRDENGNLQGELHYNRMGVYKLIYVADLFLETNRKIHHIKDPETKAYFAYKIGLLYRTVYQHFYLEIHTTLAPLTNHKGFRKSDRDFMQHVTQLETAFAEKPETT